jgi:hypothetical protein
LAAGGCARHDDTTDIVTVNQYPADAADEPDGNAGGTDDFPNAAAPAGNAG